MYKFFNYLPKNVALMIVKETTLDDQIKLSRVDKKFNQLSKDQSLELFKFKSENRKYQIADYRMVIKKFADDDELVKIYPKSTHDLFLTHQNQRIVISSFAITQDQFNNFTEKADKCNNKDQFIKIFKECFEYERKGRTVVDIVNILENGNHPTIDNDLDVGLYNFPN